MWKPAPTPAINGLRKGGFRARFVSKRWNPVRPRHDLLDSYREQGPKGGMLKNQRATPRESDLAPKDVGKCNAIKFYRRINGCVRGI